MTVHVADLPAKLRGDGVGVGLRDRVDRLLGASDGGIVVDVGDEAVGDEHHAEGVAGRHGEGLRPEVGPVPAAGVVLPGHLVLELGRLGADRDGDVAEGGVGEDAPRGLEIVRGRAGCQVPHAREAEDADLAVVARAVVEIVQRDLSGRADGEDAEVAGLRRGVRAGVAGADARADGAGPRRARRERHRRAVQDEVVPPWPLYTIEVTAEVAYEASVSEPESNWRWTLIVVGLPETTGA